jgi:hypothetical protein
VVSMMILMIDEAFDLRLQVCREVLVFQQDAILQCLMLSFDLSLCLRMISSFSDA